MGTNPLVTIITATYNLIENGRKDWFIQNLESVQGQTYKNIEHVIIDGASSDGTLEVLCEYQNKGWIRYYTEPDNGIYNAINKGILKANGKYVVCLNSDDFYCDEKALESLVQKAEETNADACYAHANRVNPNTLEIISDWPGIGNFIPWKPQFPCHQTFLIKTSVMKELGLYDTQYKVCADNDFMLKMVHNNKKFTAIDKCIINFRDGGFSNDNIELVAQEKTQCLYEEFGKYYNLTKDDCSKFVKGKFLKLPAEEAIKAGAKLAYTGHPEYVEEYFRKLFKYHKRPIKKVVKKIVRQNIINEVTWKNIGKFLIAQVFSVKNEYKDNEKRKVITILGMKLYKNK